MSMTAANRRHSVRLVILAVVSGVAVAVIYLPQTLLGDIAKYFHTSVAAAGVTATTIQVGYALGIFFLVPLADRVQPRIQVTVQALLLVIAIGVSVLLPSVGALAIGFIAVGLVANIAQVILPAANRLAPPGRAGSTTATLIGSWLAGIFGGRIISGLLVQAIGWRLILLAFAAALLLLLPLARQTLREDERVPAARANYLRLLGSTVLLLRRSPTLGQSVALQILLFATFNSLWTVVVVYLSGPTIGWTGIAAGLFGFVGLAVVLCVPIIGKSIDRWGQLRMAGAGLAIAAIASVALIFDNRLIVLYGVSMFLIALAQQITQSSVQSRLLMTNPQSPGQANTVFMFFMFVGGAFGAFIGPWGYVHGGMTQVAVQATVFVAVAIVVWIAVWSSVRRPKPAVVTG